MVFGLAVGWGVRLVVGSKCACPAGQRWPSCPAQPPCRVEMKVTRSPSATAASSSPLHSSRGRQGSQAPHCTARRKQDRTPGTQHAARPAVQGSMTTAAAHRLSTHRLLYRPVLRRPPSLDTHQSSQSVSFTSTSTPGRLQASKQASIGAGAERSVHEQQMARHWEEEGWASCAGVAGAARTGCHLADQAASIAQKCN